MSGYIGSQPADSFLSISSQQITGNGGDTYTLNLSVTSPEDVAVFVNNVRQNPNTYSVSNNQITLGGTIASSDSCYVVFLGKTLATVNPPSGSVGNNQVSASLINSQTAESSANDSDEILIYDNSATALKKQTRANFLTGVGGTNTPAFEAYKSSSQTISTGTATKLQYNTEVFDTDNCYDNSSQFRFLPTTSGKYFIFASVQSGSTSDFDDYQIFIYKNGSAYAQTRIRHHYGDNINCQVIMDMNGSSDYVEAFVYQASGSDIDAGGASYPRVRFGGFRILT
jgi:hypothetical protein